VRSLRKNYEIDSTHKLIHNKECFKLCISLFVVSTLSVGHTSNCEEGNTRRLGKQHGEEFHDLCCSHNTVTVIRLRGMGWKGLVSRTGQKRDAYKIPAGKN
jgi:hypothetical protein